MNRNQAHPGQAAEGVGYDKAPPAEEVSWQLQGNCLLQKNGCADPFYSHSSSDVDMAKRICAECPVLFQCRQWALEKHEVYGVWGGLSERDRQDLWAGRRPGRNRVPRRRPFR